MTGPTRDPRRFFGSRERVALFVAAGGRCQDCGAELVSGWHADHEQAWAQAGPTDVINGRALCPPCNMRKGQKSMGGQLRAWQQEALDRFLGRTGNFLAVATPGAGKTTFAVTAAQKLFDRSEIRFVIVVVPTAHLRRQWAASAAKIGLKLDDKFVNADGRPARDYDGVVVTYQAVANAAHLWRRLSTYPGTPTLVVFDEIHHAGDDENIAWGAALNEAFEYAGRRLLLSGTPFRTDKRRIPFVEYDPSGRAIATYDYDYGKALRDGEVVRPIIFPAMDGESKWRPAGEHKVTMSVNLADADPATLPPALRAALDPRGDWIPSVLREADAALTRVREDTPDAAGLVIAYNQDAARAYAQILRDITGEEATIAVSDDPDASDHIEAFGKKDNHARWIVAVQMVSEGVDIPRLAVGVYATRIRTQLFFIQVVGRFVRMRDPDDETCARLFIPSIGPLLAYAKEIENTVDAVIRDEEENLRKSQGSEAGSSGGGLPYEEEVVGSSAATHHSTITGGQSIATAEKVHAESVLPTVIAAGLVKKGTTAEMLAALFRFAPVQDAAATPVPPQGNPGRLSDTKRDTRKVITRKVGRLSAVTGRTHQEIHIELNGLHGGLVKHATLEQLEQRIVTLNRLLKEVE